MKHCHADWFKFGQSLDTNIFVNENVHVKMDALVWWVGQKFGGGVASRISKLQQLNNHFDNKTHPLQTIIDFLLKSYLDLHWPSIEHKNNEL